MNCIDEVETIKDANYEGIEVINTYRTVEYFIRKKLVNINAMFDFAKEYHEDVMIVNSDVIVPVLPKINSNGITILSRYDYSESIDDAEKFDLGYDVFVIPKIWLEFFPPSIYAMGAAWWDYWIPFVSMYQGIPLFYPNGKFAFHKRHPMQYAYEEWVRMGEYFRWEFKMDAYVHINQLAPLALEKIKQRLICQQ